MKSCGQPLPPSTPGHDQFVATHNKEFRSSICLFPPTKDAHLTVVSRRLVGHEEPRNHCSSQY
ncbi:hypothetical protein SCLCIDRAFT_1212263 [Scleroderma citrinum Foug A]|uniref:Uncharacterized protein n=1 Tax=Scleroderma citrinum Foug A TaxID=1036808 RepID=A0A0C2ZVL2_9AGAM|nr:hypothetical protein SCLCIDRAFT_1212263 [Scleroderma citrinum Foug A]